MANIKKTSSNSVKNNKVVKEAPAAAVEEKIEIEVPKVKKYENDDLIPCRSITNGELLMVGTKTGTLYRWADYDDVTEVEYQDLLYDVRSSRISFSTFPRFIILDDDFVSQNKQLDKVYSSVYTTSDLKDLLQHSNADIKRIFATLPYGIKDSLKGVAATMISTGEIDSVSKVKLLDELFGTELIHTLLDN